MDHSDRLKAFCVLLDQGAVVEAFQQIIPHPNICYDDIFPGNLKFSGGDDPQSQALASLSDPQAFFRCLIHYVDATVFGSSLGLEVALSATLAAIEQDPRFQAAFPNIPVNMKTELLTCFEAKKDLEQFTQHPLCDYPCYTAQLSLLKAWYRLKEAKPHFMNYLAKDSHILFRSLRYSFRYPFMMKPRPLSSKGNTPIIFMEPLEGDWDAFQASWKDQPAIFVFENEAILMQMLQFAAVEASLKESCHILYLLNHRPAEQWNVQEDIAALSFHEIALSDHAAVLTMLPIFAEKYLQGPERLFNVARNFTTYLEAARLGKSRTFAIERKRQCLNWHYFHHQSFSHEDSSGPLANDLKEHLNKLAELRHPKTIRTGAKLRIAHIAAQLITGGHAPTKIVTTLLTHHNRDQFDVFLIASEAMSVHSWEHPFCEFSSGSSLVRGGKVLEKLALAKIPAVVLPGTKTFLENAVLVHNLLKQWDIDIAIFHGPDVVNLLCAQMTSAPVRVLFEHGTLPTSPGFDIVLVSMKESLKQYEHEFLGIGMKGYFLPFPVDSKSTWLSKPFSKDVLGLPKNSFIMTTISNSLKLRMSHEFCEVVAAILARHPHAFYAPIGNIDEQARLSFEVFFANKGVKQQVRFLGQHPNPSQYARSMDLYLNEFPFGSCLGMLDAMASGCPVVSMFDVTGPPQAQYGGEYMGMDKVIHSGKKEDYIELACRLIEDRGLYEEWSNCAQRNYELRSDIDGYMTKFEGILKAPFL